MLVDEGANWILQGSEQEQRDRTAGVKALFSMLASTTSGRAKELVNKVRVTGTIWSRLDEYAGVLARPQV